MLKKIAIKKEPRLKIHKYIVTVNCRLKHKGKMCVHTKWFYCLNLKEVRQRCEQSKVGSWCEVFKADHNFIKCVAHEGKAKKK